MVRLRAGDRIKCRVKSNSIVGPYSDHDEVRSFEVVAIDDEGCYLYVPHYKYLKGSYLLDSLRSRRLNVHPRFHNEMITYISESMVASVEHHMDGECCARCKEFCPMAEPNQPDKAFLCWACLTYPYR